MTVDKLRVPAMGLIIQSSVDGIPTYRLFGDDRCIHGTYQSSICADCVFLARKEERDEKAMALMQDLAVAIRELRAALGGVTIRYHGVGE